MAKIGKIKGKPFPRPPKILMLKQEIKPNLSLCKCGESFIKKFQLLS